ncbi:MAG: rod shape-determining protein MreC [Oscillospiraceae bacterium]|nr:rod shape-determining protein MreC [Oscillospiraceae bacterium]
MKLKHYLSKYGPRLAVVVLIVALIVGLATAALEGRAGFLRNSGETLTSPLQKATTAVLDWLESLYGYIYQYDRIVEENNSLKAENARLREQSRSFSELEAENARYRELLGFREKHTDFDLASAKIVSWDASNYTSAFTISKGSDEGLELGDCVITEYGALVGQIIELGTDWSTVRTVIDVDMDVGALVGVYSYAGMVTGEFTLMKRGQTRLAYLSSGAQIFEGDEVLTSGKGGSFPAGLLIGVISAVMTEAGGQATYGIIEPAVDVGQLSQVFIIRDFTISE